MPALLGAKRHIQEDFPKLAICTYHIVSDMWEIPQLIESISRGGGIVFTSGTTISRRIGRQSYMQSLQKKKKQSNSGKRKNGLLQLRPLRAGETHSC